MPLPRVLIRLHVLLGLSSARHFTKSPTSCSSAPILSSVRCFSQTPLTSLLEFPCVCIATSFSVIGTCDVRDTELSPAEC